MELTSISLLLLLSLLSPALSNRCISRVHHSDSPHEYYDPTLPPLPTPTPCSTHRLFTHSFTHTHSFSTPYTPPTSCPSPWSHVTLSLSLSLPISLCSSPNRSYRIASIWFGSSEILRTSTAGPTSTPAIWHITKDVTPYSSLLNTTANITMAFDSSANDTAAAFHVNATLHFYTTTAKIPSPPADLILPISNSTDTSSGSWFRITNASESHSATLKIPTNTYRAVLEVYVSFHDDDEFWYSNPPDSYIEQNNLTTARGYGAFRLILATIDNVTVISMVPFPVVYAGGIHPLFWDPVVAIGAFDLPTYDLDVTPFLGVLLDGAGHEFGLRMADAASFWLVNANLHLWLDSGPGPVTAKLVRYRGDSDFVKRKSEFRRLDGRFKIKAESEHQFIGWVKSSLGNLTTDVKHKTTFKNAIEFKDDGSYKTVDMKAKLKTVMTVSDEHKDVVADLVRKYKFPLSIATRTRVGENDTCTVTTNLSHEFVKQNSLRAGHEADSRPMTVSDKQEADGWMVLQGQDIVSGSAQTEHAYQYRYDGDCYNRKLKTKDGEIVSDFSTAICSSGNLLAAS